MPAKSQAQFRKMFELYHAGKITKEELNNFTQGVNFRKLPKRLSAKKARKGAPKKKRSGGK